MKITGNQKGMTAVEYVLLVALIALVIIVAINILGGGVFTQFDSRGYREVSLRELRDNPEAFGEGAKLAVSGYFMLIRDPKSGHPRRFGNSFLYTLREEQYEIGGENPELILGEERSVTEKNPYRVKAWGILKKERPIAETGKGYILEVEYRVPFKE